MRTSSGSRSITASTRAANSAWPQRPLNVTLEVLFVCVVAHVPLIVTDPAFLCKSDDFIVLLGTCGRDIGQGLA